MKTPKLLIMSLALLLCGTVTTNAQEPQTTMDSRAATKNDNDKMPNSGFFKCTGVQLSNLYIYYATDRKNIRKKKQKVTDTGFLNRYYYLSDTPETDTFDISKIGSAKNGKYIICTSSKANSQHPDCYKILVLTDNELLMIDINEFNKDKNLNKATAKFYDHTGEPIDF